jgi:glycosyltransferase involved in cell wall biosynthesis
MLILHITSSDPAGAVYNLVRATNEHTKHRARVVTTTHLPYFEFPKDIHDLYDGGDELEALLEKADVFHLHKIREDFEISYELERGRRTFDIEQYAKGKKIIYHLHGHDYERNNVAENASEYARKERIVLASTPDLEELYKPFYSKVQYFPNCVPINDVRYLPRATDKLIMGKDGTTQLYCLFQSGTNSILKNMHVIRDVVEKLKSELPIFFLHTSPENLQSQDFTLRHKRIAHIVFDHIEGYYGLSSLEGLSMGKPVIAGLSDYTIEAIKMFWDYPGDLPWLVARNEEEIEIRIRSLIGDPTFRRKVGIESRIFMESTWSDANVARRLVNIYDKL